MTAFYSFGLLLIGGSAVVCSPFLYWGWCCRWGGTAQREGDATPSPPTPAVGLGRLAGSSTRIDAAAAIRDALMVVEPQAARQGVRLEMAVQPHLWLHTNPLSFQAVLVELIHHAVRQTPNGRVLTTGARLGGRVQISVMDDGIAVPEPVQRAALREIAEVIALQGGTLEIEAMAGEGSVLAIRLPPAPGPDGPASPPDRADRAAVEAALEWEF